MDKDTITMEIRIQEKLLEDSLRILDDAPPGSLYLRERKHGFSYYQLLKEKTPTGWKTVHKNINKNTDMIRALTNKRVAEKAAVRCKKNLKSLKNLQEVYEPCDVDEIFKALPEKHNIVEKMRRDNLLKKWKNASFTQAPKDPGRHIHETICGELVRSKSEVIIADALYSYGIPFRYEERFPYPDASGKYYYPDFVIMLPNGKTLYWEHFGLLSNIGYCQHNAEKLHHYQLNNVYIGENLIITQDNAKGSCNSAFIHRIIKNYILPYFK